MRDHLSFSAIKQFAKSPNHLIAYDAKIFEPSKAMKFGTMFHTYLLERKEFDNRYEVADIDRRTKAGKASAKKIESEGKEVCTRSDFSRITAMSAACKSIINLDGYLREVLKEGMIGGQKFVGRIDAIGENTVIDVKTTQDASPREFSRASFQHQYHLQAAIYKELCGVENVAFLAVESAAPYNAVLHTCSQDLLLYGAEKLETLIASYENWDGMPEGYGDNNLLTLPSYAL